VTKAYTPVYSNGNVYDNGRDDESCGALAVAVLSSPFPTAAISALLLFTSSERRLLLVLCCTELLRLHASTAELCCANARLPRTSGTVLLQLHVPTAELPCCNVRLARATTTFIDPQ
jgi:hypothetical protein